jgi:hypothetical protein
MAVIEPLCLWVIDAMTITTFVKFEIYAILGTDHKLAQLLCWVLDHYSTTKSA